MEYVIIDGGHVQDSSEDICIWDWDIIREKGDASEWSSQVETARVLQDDCGLDISDIKEFLLEWAAELDLDEDELQECKDL